VAAMLDDVTKETNELKRSPTRNLLLKSTKMAAMTAMTQTKNSIYFDLLEKR
jgi:hypothetical protein